VKVFDGFIIGLLCLSLFGLAFFSNSCGEVVEDETTTTTSATTTTNPDARSVSGTVNFSTASIGILGGATITCTKEGLSTVTTADAATGAYEITGLTAGTYILSASKTNWTIPGFSVNLTTTSSTAANFSAAPTSWEVHFLAGGQTLAGIGSMEGHFYLGENRASPKVIKSSSLSPTTTWSDFSAGTTEAIVELVAYDGIAIYTSHQSGSLYSTTNESSWSLTPKADVLGTGKYVKNLTFYSAHRSTSILVVLAIGSDGQLYREIIGSGPTQLEVVSSAGTGLNAAVGWIDPESGASVEAVCGDNGVAKYKMVNGSTWTSVSIPEVTDNLLDFSVGSHAGDIYFMVISANNIYMRNNAGDIIESVAGIPYSLTSGYSGISAAGEGRRSVVAGEHGLIMIHK